MSKDHENHSNELEFQEFMKPLWSKRYYIILYTVTFYILSFSSLYVIKELVNQNSINFYHQDIKFNKLLDESYFESLVSQSRLKKIYDSEDFGDIDIDDVELSLMNNSSRYIEMKNFIINDTEELLLNLLNKEEKGENQSISKESLWQNYLELDSGYYQIIFSDPNLSKFKAQKIVSHLINDFNDEMHKKNALKMERIPLFEFNIYEENYEVNLGYVTDRLNNITKIIKDNELYFVNLGADVSQFKYNINIINSEIFTIDNKHFSHLVEKLDFKVSQMNDLKKDLTSLYESFSSNGNKNIEKGLDTQVTVDAITQLIDLGKDMSSQDFAKTIMQSLYQIEIDIKSLQLELFEMKATRSLYENSSKISDSNSLDMIITKSNKLINEVNYYATLVNEAKIDLAVYEIGDLLEKKDLKYEFNIVLMSLAISIFFFFSNVISVYFRKVNHHLK